MEFSISREEKLQAAKEGLVTCEDAVFNAAIILGMNIDEIPDDFESSDSSYAVLDSAMKRLRNARNYISSLQ